MFKVQVRFFLLALIFPLFLNATYILKNDLLNHGAIKLFNDIGAELKEKVEVNGYVIATNEHFPERFNLVEYSKKYEENLSKPYVLFIFAPYALITKKSDARGRIGIIPSSENIRQMYDYDGVRDAAINVVAIKDSNTDEDKFNVGILQAYSELADNIAASKNIKLQNTIPDEMSTIVNILRVLVYSGTLILLWLFVFRPLWMRIKNGKK
jgi:hypothetical protein